MGDVADMVIDGYLCQQCGVVIDNDESGSPRTCDNCKEKEK